MSANVEWDVPQQIMSPYGTLDLNTIGSVGARDNVPFFMVREDGYQVSPGKFRPVLDSISQADGSSIQPPYIDGLVATLTVKLYVAVRGAAGATEPACGEDLRLMNQTLMGVLNSLRSYAADPNTQQRYLWTPTGLGDQRMLTDVILASWPAPAYDGKEVTVTFQLGTPFPYAIDATEIQTAITDGTSELIVNAGNAAQSPVVRVSGPSAAFAVTNLNNGQVVSYNSGRAGAVVIPGGHYAEVDFFRGSVTLSGGAGTDIIAGLDPAVTRFFLLAPDEIDGPQEIAVAGGDGLVLSNNAYV